jgi:hypothetical protein
MSEQKEHSTITVQTVCFTDHQWRKNRVPASFQNYSEVPISKAFRIYTDIYMPIFKRQYFQRQGKSLRLKAVCNNMYSFIRVLGGYRQYIEFRLLKPWFFITKLNIKITAVWNTNQCSLEDRYRHFEVTLVRIYQSILRLIPVAVVRTSNFTKINIISFPCSWLWL